MFIESSHIYCTEFSTCYSIIELSRSLSEIWLVPKCGEAVPRPEISNFCHFDYDNRQDRRVLICLLRQRNDVLRGAVFAIDNDKWTIELFVHWIHY